MGRSTAGQEMHNQLDIGILNKLTEWQSLFFLSVAGWESFLPLATTVVSKWTLNLTEAACPVRHIERTQIYVLIAKKQKDLDVTRLQQHLYIDFRVDCMSSSVKSSYVSFFFLQRV